MANPFNTIEPRYRGIIYLLLTVVAIVATWFIVKEVRAYIRRNKDRKEPLVVVDDADKELKDEEAKGETPSHPDSAYSAAANTIEKLLDGCETLDSEIQTIGAVIKVVNKPIDWLKLIKAFNVREISQCGSFGQIKDSYDLPTLLKDQLDTSGPYKINLNGYNVSGFAFESINVLSTYLKTKGVTL